MTLHNKIQSYHRSYSWKTEKFADILDLCKYPFSFPCYTNLNLLLFQVPADRFSFLKDRSSFSLLCSSYLSKSSNINAGKNQQKSLRIPPWYQEIWMGTDVKTPALGLLLKSITSNELLLDKGNEHFVSIFLSLCEKQRKAVNLHAKRVQKWPCTAERDETVQWAAANLVNDVRQSSFKTKEKETLPQLTKFLSVKRCFDLQHSFQAPQL